MGRKGQSITLSISEREKDALESLAAEFGMTWGDKANVSKLIKAIALYQLRIAPNHDWKEPRIAALKQAIDALTDNGHIQPALELAHLLLERSELSNPIRQEIERFIGNPPPAWRLELERYMNRQQPFQLTYQDAADRLWQFHIYYAQITRHEDRLYLDCWCEETEGNQDIPELQHNWCLRLDRIPEAAVSPIKGKWIKELAFIPIEIHLLCGLALAYKSKKSQDTVNEMLPVVPPIRRVVRKVSSTFWFFREVLRYGEDCVIASPETVRTRFRDKIQRMNQHY